MKKLGRILIDDWDPVFVLPNHLNRIFAKHAITCDYWYLLCNTLGDDQPVKRIPVMELKVDDAWNMILLYG